MSGEKALKTLLKCMQPELVKIDYVFITLPASQPLLLNEWAAIGSFCEPEGVTVMLPKTNADQQGFEYQAVFNLISLRVHSSLEAVGLTAAISTALAEQGISANVVAAFYHDHIFVPNNLAEKAMACLQQLTKNHKE